MAVKTRAFSDSVVIMMMGTVAPVARMPWMTSRPFSVGHVPVGQHQDVLLFAEGRECLIAIISLHNIVQADVIERPDDDTPHNP